MMVEFVWGGPELGIGKAEVRGGVATVRFFRSPADDTTIQGRPGDFRRIRVPSQTRAYVRGDDGSWRVGRVVAATETRTAGGRTTFSYEIQFPNRVGGWFLPDVFEVRSLDGRPDPGFVLSTLPETQFLHDRRREALASILEARAAAAGMEGLVSASLAILPHQAAVVRRVCLDPVERYLLADEVGMGKTIEAGAIIRGTLLDDPEAHATVLAPPALIAQWRDELRSRFHLDDFPDRWRVTPYAALGGVLGSPLPGLLVIDEAHRLLGEALPGTAAFASLARLAHAVPRLLLLSATPVIGHEEVTLGMLHLLDPEAHPLDDREGFAMKVRDREEFGRILVNLVTDADPYAMEDALGLLSEKLTGDEHGRELCALAIAALQAQEDARAYELARELSAHVADTYRIHERVIRNRRSKQPDWFKTRRGILGLQTWRDPGFEDILAAVDGWHDEARSWVFAAPPGVEREGRETAAAAALLALIGGLAGGREARAEAIEGVSRLPALASFAASHRRLLGIASACDGASPRPMVQAAVDAALALRRSLRLGPTERARLVVWASASADAAAIRQRLAETFGPPSTFSLTGSVEAEEVAPQILAFRNAWQDAVLVCDRSMEEGLNLTFAHGIVHADLPFDPARIEQRIGRLDRIGRTLDSIEQRVVLPDCEDSPWEAWVELLGDGLHIFRESVSDVQFVLPEVIAVVARALFNGGADGIREAIADIEALVARERARLDQQYYLDDVAAHDDATVSAVQGLLGWEAGGPQHGFRRALHGWTQEALRFGVVQRPSRTLEYRFEEGTQIPAIPWKERFADGIGRRLTFERSAVADGGRAQLIRPGNAFFEALDRFTRWDDRGAAFATLRRIPGWRASWMGFRLCFVVEPDLERIRAQLDPSLERAAIRRAQAYLPPLHETIYLDFDFVETTDPEVLAALERPYKDPGLTDVNLGSRPELLSRFVDPARFRSLIETARESAERLLRASPRYERDVRGRIASATTELDVARTRLERRARRNRRGDAARLDEEKRVNQVVRDAIRLPSVWLDAIGLIVLSGGEAE